MNERIATSVFWVVASRGVIQVLSLVSTLLVARLLSPDDYGVMAVAVALTGALVLITELGIGTTIVQFPTLRAEELNACFWFAMGSATGAYALLYLGAPWIARWFGILGLDEVLRALGLGLPIAALRVVPESLLRKSLHLDKVVKAETLAILLTIPVVVGFAAAGAGVWALVMGALFTTCAQTMGIYWYRRWRPGFRIGSARHDALIRFSGAAVGTRFLASTYQQVDAFVLGKMAGDMSLGFFSMAKQLALLPVEKISTVVNQVLYPVFAELQADRRATQAAFLTGFRLVMCLTIPVCAGTALVADDVVSVLLTDKWLPAVPLLRILCLYAVVRSLDVLLPPVLFARYRAPFLFWYAMALLLVMTPAFWAGAASFGAAGVALAWVVVYPALMVVMAREACRELEIGWGLLWEQVSPAVAAAVVMAGVVLAVQWLVPGADSAARVLRLALASGLGALAYLLGLLWGARPLIAELTQAAKLVVRSSKSSRVSAAAVLQHQSTTP